jgi:8-oxo-dGTP pyrophosphatase MutT (NUDIX family)
MPKYRKSYGIALCRYNNEIPEIILIKKRYTYYFFEFVLGKYQKNDNKYLTKLFNNMTYQEKMDILSLKFDNLWYKIWLEIPSNIANRDPSYPSRVKELGFNEKRYKNSYIKSKSKFECNFLVDNGEKLKRLINNSTNAETIWEIPRGRKISNEREVDAAIREFYEETAIDAKKYSILWHINPIVNSFRDSGVVYKTTYYIAAVNENNKPWTPKVHFNSYDQILEIEAIKWVSLNEINILMLNKKTKIRTVKLFKTIIDLFKKYCKSV